MAENVLVEERDRLLALVDILEPLPSGEIEHLAARHSFVHLEAGECLALEENQRSLFLLASGRVRVYDPDPAGQELTISVIDSGTVVGQTGFAARVRRALRAQALEPSLVFRLGWEDFEDLVRQNPEVGIKLIRLLSVRLSVGEDRLSDLAHKEVPTRLASIILKLSEHQGIVTRDGSRKLSARYTHQQLGSMIGSNREAVTRALKRLREEGGVEVRRRQIHIVDLDALKRIAGEPASRSTARGQRRGRRRGVQTE